MKIAIGCDHRGIEFKSKVISILKSKNIEVIDVGTDTEKSCDYPDFGFKVAEFVAQNKADWGILICNSGIGMSIVANKVKGIRAALCINEKLAEYSRLHNNANVLVIGAGFVSIELAESIINKWLETKFEGDRHIKRLQKISDFEEKQVSKEECDRIVKKWQDEVRKWQSKTWRR
ncbi:MAG: ribose 5-phosphate isomerase B [bacterium]